jgi:hypothetical protein
MDGRWRQRRVSSRNGEQPIVMMDTLGNRDEGQSRRKLRRGSDGKPRPNVVTVDRRGGLDRGASSLERFERRSTRMQTLLCTVTDGMMASRPGGDEGIVLFWGSGYSVQRDDLV